jgi:CarD family transcriptional regulator
MMFKVGDLAVYPAQGVGRVAAVESKQIAGHHVTFYVLEILGKETTIRIPTANAAAVGLRQILNEDEVPRLFAILKKKKGSVSDAASTWNKRFRDYNTKLKSGSAFDIAEVLRDLFVLKSGKDLSFGERRMLDTALNLLTKELAIVLEATEAKVEDQLRGLLQAN